MRRRRMTGDGLVEEESVSDQRKLGMCNYCQALGPVFEQETAEGVPTFLICHNCIGDVFVGLEVDKRVQDIRQRHNSTFEQWMNHYRDNPGE